VEIGSQCKCHGDLTGNLQLHGEFSWCLENLMEIHGMLTGMFIGCHGVLMGCDGILMVMFKGANDFFQGFNGIKMGYNWILMVCVFFC
jgi:hypothetical protein